MKDKRKINIILIFSFFTFKHSFAEKKCNKKTNFDGKFRF